MGDILKNVPEATNYIIGLLFILVLLALMSSLLAEVISRTLRFRSKTLEQGVRNLLDDELAKRFYSHPFIRGFARVNPRAVDKPAYLPPRVFSSVLLDIISPEHKSQGDRYDAICRVASEFGDVNLRSLFSVFLENAGRNLKSLHEEIGFWFENSMTRVSVRYQRKIQALLFLIGFLISVALNADAIMMAKILSTAPTVKAVVSKILQEEVAEVPKTRSDGKPSTPDPIYEARLRAAEKLRVTEKLRSVQAQMEELSILGWSATKGTLRGFPATANGWIQKVMGLGITAFAIAFIAPLLFDLLSKLVNLRGAESRYT